LKYIFYLVFEYKEAQAEEVHDIVKTEMEKGGSCS
jgi:hypothetical protein